MIKRSGRNWIDVSVPLHSGMVNWPSDPPVIIKKTKDLYRGDNNTVSFLQMGSHTGTHMDAPLHFIKNTKSIDEMPLEATVGRASVLPIRDAESIKPNELKKFNIRPGDRVLFKTRNSARCWKKGKFVKDYVYLTLDAARHLARKGIRALGVDYLSIGGYKKDGMEVHRTILGAGIWVIEGLDLSKAKPGLYDLVCLPLKLLHGDGAPARAILRYVQPLPKKR